MGEVVHYKVRLRCEMKLYDSVHPEETPRAPIAHHNDPQEMCIVSSDSDAEDISETTAESSAMQKVEVLCFRLFASMLDHNITADGVTANLQAWLSSVGGLLPLEVRAEIPRNQKQLVARFNKRMLSIDRLPMCPAECSLLDDIRPSLDYICDCDGKAHRPWR